MIQLIDSSVPPAHAQNAHLFFYVPVEVRPVVFVPNFGTKFHPSLDALHKTKGGWHSQKILFSLDFQFEIFVQFSVLDLKLFACSSEHKLLTFTVIQRIVSS